MSLTSHQKPFQPYSPPKSDPRVDPLADIRRKVAAGQVKAAAHTSKPAKPADRAINPHELDALYQAGTLTVVGSNSHYAGLRAVYDAGAKR